MASLDSLPADQRAVLQLVLQRDRSYDEIAQLLSIDRTAVRERALAAFEALGPQTRVAPERRALITDYLLGQLSEGPAEETRGHLAQSAGERAWARVVASELAPLADRPLPEIPVQSGTPEPAQAPIASAPGEEPAPAPARDRETRDHGAREPEPPAESEPGAGEPEPGASEPEPGASEPEPAARRSSRVGGAIMLGAGALVAVVVVAVILIAGGGSSSSHSSSSTPAAGASTPTASTPAASTPTGTTTTAAKPIAQVNLVSPTGDKKTLGVAEVIKQGTNTGLVIVAKGVPANTSHDAYAVWLYNSASDSHILGFVNPGVKTDGKLQTEGLLPTNASHFKQLLVTLETQAKPTAPGKIVLQGTLNLP
jgi:hypothetical protein